MIEALTEEMMASNLTQWIQATYWLWPILEIFHFFGLTLLMGGLIIVDLRMIGFFSDIGLEEVKKLLPLVIFGFLLNLITGVLFLFGDPSRYSINIGFQIKMILPEGKWIESDTGVAPPYQRPDAIADAISEEMKLKERFNEIEFVKPEAMRLIFK